MDTLSACAAAADPKDAILALAVRGREIAPAPFSLDCETLTGVNQANFICGGAC